MGSAASINSISLEDQAFMSNCEDLYLLNPEKWDQVYNQIRNKYINQKSKMDITMQENVSKNNHNEIFSNNFQENYEPVDFSNEIAQEITLLRTNPKGYIKYVEHHLSLFKDDFLYSTNIENSYIRTIEGKKAVIELIDVLNNTSKLNKMTASPIITLAAMDHQRDLAINPNLSHTGSNGSTTGDRITKHGQWFGSVGENIDYGNYSTRDIIIHLLVDDGVPSRGHRINLLSPSFELVGACRGYHSIYKTCCVMNFATSVKSFDDIITTDKLIVLTSSPLSNDALKVINSIPSDKNTIESLINEINNSLKDGIEVTIDFKISIKAANIKFVETTKQGISTKIKKLCWG